MNLEDLNPKKQKKLFFHNSTFNEIVQIYKKKKLPNKILFNGPKGIGKATLTYHLVNYIFSKDEDNKYDLNNLMINSKNRSYNLVLNNSHPNFYLINLLEDKKLIEISQIRKMINYANKSSFNNKERIIIIDNVEKLNTNALNALLKIIEEPNEKIFFF